MVDVIKIVVELLDCYINDCKLFDKVIDVIDEVGVVQYLVLVFKWCKIIGIKEIEVVVVKIVCILLKNVFKDDVEVFKDFEKMFKCVVFGQDIVIEVLFFVIKLVWVGLCEFEKFIGNYFFVGLIGVGKIEVVKQLVDMLGVELLCFDMFEYMEKYVVFCLIGVFSGYVGFDQGG